VKKTPSLFKRNYETDRRVRDEVVEGSEWVLAGEGRATRKWDGTCCLFRDGLIWRRYDRKLTKQANKQKRTRTGKVLEPLTVDDFKAAPAGWEACHAEPDLNTGHWPGWLPVGDEPESKWHLAAFRAQVVHGTSFFVEGRTYELCGPHFQGNPEQLDADVFIEHGIHVLSVPLTFDGIRDYLAAHEMEGIVWHHPDGRVVKIKAGDFGIDWPRKVAAA